MSPLALTRPERRKVNRSELRQKYFEELVQRLRSTIETLEITSNQKLFNQILGSIENLEENTRLGKLHSFAEAFGEE